MTLGENEKEKANCLRETWEVKEDWTKERHGRRYNGLKMEGIMNLNKN